MNEMSRSWLCLSLETALARGLLIIHKNIDRYQQPAPQVLISLLKNLTTS